MSVTFRITTAADYRESPTALISEESLAAFRAHMHAREARSGVKLIDPDMDDGNIGDGERPSHYLQARVCPLAVASIAAIFDFDPAVIAVVDEAQFRQRRISINRSCETGIITMRVSIESDPGYEMNLASGNALALVEALGGEPETVGEFAIADIRARLASPAVKRRCERHQVTQYLPRIQQLLTLAEGDDSAVFEWA
ncbi:hypothetical protein FHS96_005757 [Sphingomonas zeicaulis]|uniref:hypothetical protein n=1 Tax=Sphingomonas zeicaulis TaxID=1632740 RepID=UPI003D2251BD